MTHASIAPPNVSFSIVPPPRKIDNAGAKENDVRAADVIKNWLRNRYTLEFLGTWETIHNPGFKVVGFDHFRKEAGLPSFVLSCSEWIEKT